MATSDGWGNELARGGMFTMFNTCRVLVAGAWHSSGAQRVVAALHRIGCADIAMRGRMDEDCLCSGKIDVIVVTPGGDVLDRIAALKAGTAACFVPIVVVLDGYDENLRAQSFRRGAHDVIGGLVDDDELFFKLRGALDSRIHFRALLMDRDRLEDEIAKSSVALEETRLEITRRLGRAAEFRDNETGHHVIRVSGTAAVIAQALGMNLRTMELVAQASPLHDIGKIGIPDNILLKPGRLSAAEWRIMKRHTVIGARILLGSDEPLMQTARQIALTHHENWDGSGYPRHLAGERIPISGRIVAVCDVFDALTSKRPYKEPWCYAAAFDYIGSHAGTQFDPKVVGAFVEAKKEISAIADRYAEPEYSGARIYRYYHNADGGYDGL